MLLLCLPKHTQHVKHVKHDKLLHADLVPINRNAMSANGDDLDSGAVIVNRNAMQNLQSSGHCVTS